MKKDLKVLLFTDTYCDTNGVSRFIQDMARLADEGGHTLYVVSSSLKCTTRLSNVVILKPLFQVPIPFYPKLNLVFPSYKALKKIVDHINPDAVHISTPGFVGFMGKKIAKKRSLPIIGTYHTDFSEFAYKNMPFSIIKKITNSIMHSFYRDFETIFVRSEEYTEILTRDIKLNISSISLLKAGTDRKKFHPEYRDMEIWNKYSIAPLATKALYVGRVTKEKNFPLLVELWQSYYEQSKEKNIYLVVVGGDIDPLLFTSHHIKSLGIQQGEELSKIYASSDLFLFPSTTDTLGQVVMEAICSGVPVVVSDKGGPKTLIGESKKAGYAIDVSDKSAWIDTIALLMRDTKLRQELAENTKPLAAQMSIEQSFEMFWQKHQESLHQHQCHQRVIKE